MKTLSLHAFRLTADLNSVALNVKLSQSGPDLREFPNLMQAYSLVAVQADIPLHRSFIHFETRCLSLLGQAMAVFKFRLGDFWPCVQREAPTGCLQRRFGCGYVLNRYALCFGQRLRCIRINFIGKNQMLVNDGCRRA